MEKKILIDDLLETLECNTSITSLLDKNNCVYLNNHFIEIYKKVTITFVFYSKVMHTHKHAYNFNTSLKFTKTHMKKQA